MSKMPDTNALIAGPSVHAGSGAIPGVIVPGIAVVVPLDPVDPLPSQLAGILRPVPELHVVRLAHALLDGLDVGGIDSLSKMLGQALGKLLRANLKEPRR